MTFVLNGKTQLPAEIQWRFLKQEKAGQIVPGLAFLFAVLRPVSRSSSRPASRSTRTTAATPPAPLTSRTSGASRTSDRSSWTPFTRCCHRNAISAVVVNLFALFYRRAIVIFEVLTTLDHDRARVR
jgi:hypothetical protein